MKSDSSEEKQLRVRRGRVASVDLYEIKDNELDLLEHGSPSGIYMNFGIFLLSISFSAIATLCTTTQFKYARAETMFMIISVVGLLVGILLMILWWRLRKSISATIRQIRDRIPQEPLPSDETEEASPVVVASLPLSPKE